MATRNQLNLTLSGTIGSGSFVGSTDASIDSPVFTNPGLGTPVSGDLQNCTNFIWGKPSGASMPLQFTSGTISAAQLKTLNASPVQVIVAPGPNQILLLRGYMCKFNYIAPAYTAAAAQTIRMRYNTTVNSLVTTVFSNGVLTGTADAVSFGPCRMISSATSTTQVNLAITFVNPVATEITVGNGTMNYYIWYQTLDVTL